MSIITPMDKTTTKTQTDRYGNVYRVTYQITDGNVDDLLPGDEIFEGPAWSSSGIKDGFWSLVTEADFTDEIRDYYGEEITYRRVTKKERIG